MKRLEDFPDESGLTGTRLSNHPDDLTMAFQRLREYLRQKLHLCLATHHRAEAPHRRRLQPCLHWPCAQYRKDLQWITQPLDRHGAE